MKIKMLTTKCGPDPKENWNEGQVREVCVEEARYWHEAGVCTPLEPYPADAQKAVTGPAEKAVVKPTETAKGNVSTPAAKPPVEAPASPEGAKPATNAADWGKKEA